MATDLDLFTDDATAIDRETTRAHTTNGTSSKSLPGELFLPLTVADRDTIAELCQRPDGEVREEYALQALRIGVLALRQARGQLDADVIQRESQRMLNSLQHQLESHAALMQRQLAGSLQEYFDPKNGRFQERIERLIKQDGELEQVLRRQVGEKDSALCKTLVNHLGDGSPLLKLLTPDESKGLLGALRNVVDGQLAQQREHVLREFSLDNKEGALARLVTEIISRNGQLTCDLQTKIDLIAREFSFDNEASAIKRFEQLLADTRQAVNANLTLDDDTSALARMKKEVLGILESHHRLNRDFQEQVKVSLAQMVARREESERSTRHGVAFEEAVCEWLDRFCEQCGDVAERTGNRPGTIRGCKTGDCVIHLSPECAAAGARIVIEAKEQAGYNLAKAQEEIEQARKNRDAQFGVFIFSKKFVPGGLDEQLRKIGNDVFVVWDYEDAHTDMFLKGALIIAKSLCVRSSRRSESQHEDFDAICSAVADIERQSGLLTEVTTAAGTIQNATVKILERMRIAKDCFERQVAALHERVSQLRSSLEN